MEDDLSFPIRGDFLGSIRRKKGIEAKTSKLLGDKVIFKYSLRILLWDSSPFFTTIWGRFFPTCQVRVVRFYVSLDFLLLLLLRLLLLRLFLRLVLRRLLR